MRFRQIQQIMGIFLLIFSLTLIIPMLMSIGYDDGQLLDFVDSFMVASIAGLVLWLPVRNVRAELRAREGFIIVALFWAVFGMISALPFIIGPHLSFTDSVFESISAFTTTGATVIVGLDHLPPSVLFYRQQLQWYGGMGIVVLAVAVLPMLGVGGMQLYRAETPGPAKDEKIAPRIVRSAQTLWLIYVAMTVACALLYWIAGMSLFDAVGHAFSTISTGGFSTHDASMAYFNNPWIEVIAIVFMLMGAINFGVHFMVLKGRSPRYYLRDTEVRVFLIFVFILILVITIRLMQAGVHTSFFEALRYASFTLVSVVTSTGFATEDFSVWPLSLPALLILSSFVGGCAGSTAGGMKVVRFIILIKQGKREIDHLIHPRMVGELKVGGRVVSERVMSAVWGFFAAYVGVFSIIMLLLMATGLDQVTAFSAVATCMNNLGPGLGEVTSNFVVVSDTAKWLLSLAMLMGRLEIFTLLVLLMPEFWSS